MPNPSPTHDSEDWLDEAIDKLTIKTRWSTPKPFIGDKQIRSISGKKQLKQQILAHYAHYLKPEDVERIKLEAQYDTARTILHDTGGDSDARWTFENAQNEHDRLEAQLSKLNREEKKDGQ